VDCEVTAIDTAILLPGSVEFLTMPWVTGPGRGAVRVLTTVDWTLA